MEWPKKQAVEIRQDVLPCDLRDGLARAEMVARSMMVSSDIQAEM